MSVVRASVAGVMLSLLAGCQNAESNESANEPAVVAPTGMAAELKDAAGAVKGKVEVGSEASGLVLRISVDGLSEGPRGLHLHEKGICEGPDFKSAGGHWNPGGKQHGRDNPQGAHLGDLANLQVGADGKGETVIMVGGTSIGGAQGIADADGTALLIHAKADDYKTDPSGDSGDRIICAVLAPPSAS